MSKPLVQLHPETTGWAHITLRLHPAYVSAHGLDSSAINDATVLLSIYGKGGALLESHPVTYIEGSEGEYDAEVPHDIGVQYNEEYRCEFLYTAPISRQRKDSVTVRATMPSFAD